MAAELPGSARTRHPQKELFGHSNVNSNPKADPQSLRIVIATSGDPQVSCLTAVETNQPAAKNNQQLEEVQLKTKYGLIVAAIAILGACSKQESPQQASTPAPASAPVAAPAPAPAAPAVAATPAPDNTSLANYEAVDGTDATWLTYVSVTHTTSQPAQDELLNLFSAKYYNEHDTFKKHDLIETEWPPIQSNLKHYAAQNYYAVPFGGSTNLNSPEALMLLTNAQPYDFGSKSFPIGSFANASFGNRQNVFFTMNEDTSRFGQIKVEDEALARQIEQLRTSGMLSLRGLLYIRVDNVQNGNQVHVTVQHMHVNVYDKPAYLQGGGKLVASYDI